MHDVALMKMMECIKINIRKRAIADLLTRLIHVERVFFFVFFPFWHRQSHVTCTFGRIMLLTKCSNTFSEIHSPGCVKRKRKPYSERREKANIRVETFQPEILFAGKSHLPKLLLTTLLFITRFKL